MRWRPTRRFANILHRDSHFSLKFRNYEQLEKSFQFNESGNPEEHLALNFWNPAV